MPIGTVWADDTWGDGAWADDSWADAGTPPDYAAIASRLTLIPDSHSQALVPDSNRRWLQPDR